MSRFALTLLAATVLASPAWPQPPKPEGWVVLPVADYRALREKADPVPPELEPPPTDASLSRLDYELHVEGDAALGEIRAAIDVLKEGFVRVPVLSGLLVREARLGDRAVALFDGGAAQKGGGAGLVLSKQGRHSLTLDVVVPVASSAGAESLSLPAANASVSHVALSLPRNGLDVAVSGGLLVETQEAGDRTRIVAHASPGQALSISWRRRAEDRRSELPVRIRGNVAAFVGLAEDAAQVSAQVRIDVVQGLLRAAEVALPEGFVVNQVSGALVADWEAKPGRLAISLVEPADRGVAFVVTGESRAPREGQITIPLLRLSGAERETGGAAVEVLGAGEITQHQARGLDASDASDLGEAVAGRDSPSLVAFRYRPLDGTAPRTLGVLGRPIRQPGDPRRERRGGALSGPPHRRGEAPRRGAVGRAQPRAPVRRREAPGGRDPVERGRGRTSGAAGTLARRGAAPARRALIERRRLRGGGRLPRQADAVGGERPRPADDAGSRSAGVEDRLRPPVPAAVPCGGPARLASARGL